jgi:ubiquinone biosynthesis protein UbiJ
MPVVDASLEILEEAINRYLELDDYALTRLARLHGKVIAFHISGADIHLYFVPAPGRLQVHSHLEGEPDCTIKGSLISLAKLASRDKNEQLFGGDVEITGDAGIAHRFGQILGATDIDWEEHLSRVIGDIPAHQSGRLIRDLLDWGTSARQTLELDVAEYLQEEINTLPHPEEVSLFEGEVDKLRDDIERLEARIGLIKKCIEESSQ